MFNQARKIDFMNIVFPLTTEEYGSISLIDYLIECHIKHNTITTVTQFTYVQ